jgi:DNA-directed RNA polymerase specialized sigma24 family protein
VTRDRPDRRIEELLRELAPAVLAALARRHQGFDVCEDAVQEALLAAATGGRSTVSPVTRRAGWSRSRPDDGSRSGEMTQPAGGANTPAL